MTSSASHNVNVNAGVHTVATTDFWNDATIEITSAATKKKVPTLPKISNMISVVNGGGVETLAYLALQMAKTTEKKHIIRVMASATAWLIESKDNVTGSPVKPTPLKGLERALDEDAPEDEVLQTNLEDAEPVTVGELMNLMENIDADELGAYFGILYLAGNKRVTRENRAAFNDNRRNAASASLTRELMIFVPDSPFLTIEVLSHVYAAFLSFTPIKAVMTARVVEMIDHDWIGPGLAFINMFALLSNSGLSALGIIKEATLKHPWIRHEFPELRTDYAAANEAFAILQTVPAKERPFIKAIHGNNFQPVAYALIDNLTGVCKNILKLTTPSYQNYGGGRCTDAQMAKIRRHTAGAAELVTTVAAE